MRTLSLVRRAIKYPFSPPTTPQKVVLALLGLALGLLALVGANFALLIIPSIVILSGILPGGDSFDEIEAARLEWVTWEHIQYHFGYPVSPQWAPDGSAIYIGVEWSREFSTYVVSSDGSELKELKHVLRPNVSPGGSRIVYSTRKDTGKYSYDIETAKPDGSDRRRLTEDSTYIDIAPAWSPDGSRIAFARVTHPSQDIDPETDKRGIYVMAADGSGLRWVYRLRRPLPEAPDYEGIRSGPVWSPDGETLAFAITEPNITQRQGREVVYNLERAFVYTIGADGSDLTAVYDGPPWGGFASPSWSPDGGSLAFRFTDPYIINSDGKRLRKAADVGAVRSVSWSPDGTKLLLIGHTTKRHSNGGIQDFYGMHVAEVDGGGYRFLGDPGRGSRAAWSPDGSRIAFTKQYDSNTEYPEPLLQTMAPDGSAVQVLVERHRYGELRAANPVNR